MADIGARMGRLPQAWPTVSKAMKVAPLASAASSSAGAGPKCWKLKTVGPVAAGGIRDPAALTLR
jgi:hypothetical protein